MLTRRRRTRRQHLFHDRPLGVRDRPRPQGGADADLPGQHQQELAKKPYLRVTPQPKVWCAKS